ncbi:hypothetical protein [Robertkochia aurantiaca]|uniref:hypothetical protein n=1 Tax=Robertkochia aurantiaca TaxID=2873700 RepID=UPI001CCB5E31|nr:hypothetical protein [Robertkochia sp. 3YJGBD-33]
MKKLCITLSDEQYEAYENHIKRGSKINLEEETFSGFGIILNHCELGAWLEVDMYGKLDLGDVEWSIEDAK